MIRSMDFDKLGEWVHQRISDEKKKKITVDTIKSALSTTYSIFSSSKSTFLLEDFFPNSDLEILCIPTNKGIDEIPEEAYKVELKSLPTLSLMAVGDAVATEMARTGNDLFSHQLDHMEVFVFKSSVRAVVLQATGVTLLSD